MTHQDIVDSRERAEQQLQSDLKMVRKSYELIFEQLRVQCGTIGHAFRSEMPRDGWPRFCVVCGAAEKRQA